MTGEHSSIRQIHGPTSPQSAHIASGSGQSYILFPTFTLESGVILHNVPLAYKTWGTLDPDKKSNALVVCHALTGSADVEDWWGPLLGPGKVFDPTRFFIVCANVFGSPYGSAGPCTTKGGEDGAREAGWDGQGWWGPEFPATTVRDDVRATKQLLDHLGVEQIAAIIGGSMGGMSVLEWPLLFPIRFPPHTPGNVDLEAPAQPERPYIRTIVPIATAARHSAWCISWAEAQRQSIYSDPAFDHGYYHPLSPPRAGLSAARMAALLTYRSRDSFESRFGRRMGGIRKGSAVVTQGTTPHGQGIRRTSVAEEAVNHHNEGNQSPRVEAKSSNASMLSLLSGDTNAALPPPLISPSATKSTPTQGPVPTPSTGKVFSAQSYLRYQGEKFVNRFDANCYIHLTRKMDTHDVARGRADWGLGEDSKSHEAEPIEVEEIERQGTSKGEVNLGEKRLPREGEEDDDALIRVLSFLSRGSFRFGAPPPSVQVVSIESDGLFAPPEQEILFQLIEGSKLVSVKSTDGHDGFLLEFEQINHHVETFLKSNLADIYQGEGVGHSAWKNWGQSGKADGASIRLDKTMQASEVDDVTRW
ncbi:hypothetical protein CBS101457_004142 [Exobasidium rhododendri]|nr:hypothetical protein CBS101457_004142 [Exobasidium rhododendri]